MSEITESDSPTAEIPVQLRTADTINLAMSIESDKRLASYLMKMALELLFQMSVEDAGFLIEEASVANGRDFADLLMIFSKRCKARLEESPADTTRCEAAALLIQKASNIMAELGKE